MEEIALADAAKRLKRGNKLLFTRDSACLQELRGTICQQKHRTLVLWAFDCVSVPLQWLAQTYPNEQRPGQAVALCRQWARGEIKMPAAKRALLQAHAAAKAIEDPVAIALFHAVGQACATVHVETHALGLPFYELTAIVHHFGIANCTEPIEKKIVWYLHRLRYWQEHVDDPPLKWASFLLDDSRPNKELLLLQGSGKKRRRFSPASFLSNNKSVRYTRGRFLLYITLKKPIIVLPAARRG